MMRRWQVLLLGMLISGVGCSVDYFRAETELHSDGRVTRVICQPTLPDDLKSGWDVRTVNFVEELKSDELSLDQISFQVTKPPPKRKPEQPNRYVLARGEFPSVEKIAAHYRRSAAGDHGAAAELQPHSERKSLVFVTEHLWEERLTDVVRLEDIPAARRELVELSVPLILKVLANTLGPDIDLAETNTWLRADGAAWFEELVWLYVDVATRHRSRWPLTGDAEKQAEARLSEIHRRRGLKSNEDEEVRRFAAALLKRLLKSKSGKPVTDEQIKSALVALRLAETQEEGPDPFEKAILEQFGSPEAYEKRLQPIVSRIVGVHHPWQTQQQFDFRLKPPGFVIDTNGTLQPDQHVHWRFNAAEAFPFGYLMRCRSLEPNLEEQQAAFGKVVIKTSVECQQFVRLVRAAPEWIGPLQECVAQKSRKPLIDLHNQFQENFNEDEKKRFGELFRLLVPPAIPAKPE